MKNSKLKELEKLRSEIIDKNFKESWKDVWFYPEYNGVKGFLGTQGPIFCGLNPSYGNFPSKRDEFFYKQLKKHGFENAHITDLIKIRSTGKKIGELIKNKQILNEQCGFLTEEIKITESNFIVALGNECYCYIKDKFEDATLEKITHYTYRFIKEEEFKEKFKKEMKKMKEKYGRYLKDHNLDTRFRK